ncbi:hypothetical protein HLB23_14115 [Nocardia uniformis]|uniref:Uncharacterized protein n=1 Tax=Nocardia uniformis TaxID=53432 RepID=A0A849BXI1_9NOCA|nr:hypothetical protein [Nocardia uniformis]NNH70984.1 hypothetical protein [Nocardia uniformis]
MIDTLSREDYEQAAHFGSAGPASHLDEHTVTAWRRDIDGWSGKHWIFLPGEDGVWTLRPLNVNNRKRS